MMYEDKTYPQAIKDYYVLPLVEKVKKYKKYLEKITEEKGLKQVSDSGALEALVEKTLDENPQPVADFKTGKQNAVGFLVGQVMKASKGQANPQMVNELVRKKLAS